MMMLPRQIFHIAFFPATSALLAQMVVQSTGGVDEASGYLREANSAEFDTNVHRLTESSYDNDPYYGNYGNDAYYGGNSAYYEDWGLSAAATTAAATTPRPSLGAQADDTPAAVSDIISAAVSVLDAAKIRSKLSMHGTTTTCSGVIKSDLLAKSTPDDIKFTCDESAVDCGEGHEAKKVCACECQKCIALCEGGTRSARNSLDCRAHFKAFCVEALRKAPPEKHSGAAQSQHASLAVVDRTRMFHVAVGASGTGHVLRRRSHSDNYYSYDNGVDEYDGYSYDYYTQIGELGGALGGLNPLDGLNLFSRRRRTVLCHRPIPWQCGNGNLLADFCNVLHDCVLYPIAEPILDPILNQRRRGVPETCPHDDNCWARVPSTCVCAIHSVSVAPKLETTLPEIFQNASIQGCKITFDPSVWDNWKITLESCSIPIDLVVTNNNPFPLPLCKPFTNEPVLTQVEGIAIAFDECTAGAIQPTTLSAHINISKLTINVKRRKEQDTIPLPNITFGPLWVKAPSAVPMEFVFYVDLGIILKVGKACIGATIFDHTFCLTPKIPDHIGWRVDPERTEVKVCLGGPGADAVEFAEEKLHLGKEQTLCQGVFKDTWLQGRRLEDEDEDRGKGGGKGHMGTGLRRRRTSSPPRRRAQIEARRRTTSPWEGTSGGKK